MRFPDFLPAVAIALGLGCAVPAAASVVSFTATSFNINPPAAPGFPCAAPLLNLAFGPAGTDGTSNLGHFTYTQAHCALGGPGAYGGGVFQYFFYAGDMLQGTYTGVLAPTGTPGLLSNAIDYTVTGGTGRFLEATGEILGTGTLDFRNGPARADLVLAGRIDLLAVPEPATVSLLFAGSAGVIGGLYRGRRRRSTR